MKPENIFLIVLSAAFIFLSTIPRQNGENLSKLDSAYLVLIRNQNPCVIQEKKQLSGKSEQWSMN